MAPHYTGRFAPSPTGPLHLGSLLTAVASYLDCRAVGGRWLLRIEDLDPPRELAGAAEQILHSLQRHGLAWDGPVLWQHQRHDPYERALTELRASGRVFPCHCSRSELAGTGGLHPGRCSKPPSSPHAPYALRFVVDAVDVGFEDRLQGPQSQNLAREAGNFVVKRKDGLYAYQLAVVVDDAYQGVTDIVRGCDLLDSTPRQLALQQALQLPAPRYLHVPVLVGPDGRKLSKQNLAPALDSESACANLRRVLQLLGQPTPPETADTPQLILAAATATWSPQRLPATTQLPI